MTNGLSPLAFVFFAMENGSTEKEREGKREEAG